MVSNHSDGWLWNFFDWNYVWFQLPGGESFIVIRSVQELIKIKALEPLISHKNVWWYSYLALALFLCVVHWIWMPQYWLWDTCTGIVLCMHPANERWRYIVTPSLIGWAHTGNDSLHVGLAHEEGFQLLTSFQCGDKIWNANVYSYFFKQI